MGLFSAIGKGIGKVFGIGGGSKGYKSPYVGSYEQGARAGIANRLGATSYKDKKGNVQYDYSNVGKPLSVADANKDYDYSGINEAQSGFRTPSLFKETYTSGYQPKGYQASNFNFQSLPEQYGRTAYDLGAKDVRRESQGDLSQIQQTIGPRSPGLLMKAAQANKRDLRSTLADLNAKVRLEEMRSKTDLGVKQQLEQAAENYRAAGFNDEQARAKANEDYLGYQSRSGLEQANADERFRNLSSLADTGKSKVALQSDTAQKERDYRDQALNYLMNLFTASGGLTAQEAAQGTARRGQTLDFLGKIMSGAK